MANQPGQLRPYGPALWAGLVVVGLLICTSALGRPATIATTGGAGWLPADGYRQRFAGPDGVETTEWAVDQAVSLIGSGPAQFATWLSLTKVDWAHAHLARLSTVLATSDGTAGGRSDDLFSLGSDGVRAEVVSGFDGTSRIYVPGRLDLPDTLAAGSTWSSEGAVLLIDAAGSRATLGYRADYSAARADMELLARGCVVVTMREQIGRDQPSTTDRTWCRHAGFAGWSTPEGSWQATNPTPAPVSPDAPFDWSAADRLVFTPRQVNVIGTGTTLVTAVSPPGLLADGTAVFANQVNGDLVALQTEVDPPPSVWRSRPGVRNTTAATFGTTTVVASANRRLVAYGPDGDWLWDSPLADLSIVTPVRLGDLVVAVTLDGSVTAYDLATGAARWRQNVGSEVRVAPQVAGQRVLVVDQGGQLSCFDATGAPVWTASVGRVEQFGVTTGANPVVVVPNSDGPRVAGLSLADGTLLWRPRHTLSTHGVIGLDDVAVLRAENETIGIDPATGQKVWSWQGARTWAGIGGGNRALLLAGDRVVLLDAHGADVAEWPVDIGDVSGSTTWLAAAKGRVLIYGPSGVAIGVVK
ncbi:MAG TPA: PQQ-binding-like beta-propeller repeat protein [Propionicimonas sp.]|uniref:outer membrane protein assembly factor BamB family protein n=1 Tax=Propionicimonas sp. TaxID=1955623 RepID=UPI002F41740B